MPQFPNLQHGDNRAHLPRRVVMRIKLVNLCKFLYACHRKASRNVDYHYYDVLGIALGFYANLDYSCLSPNAQIAAQINLLWRNRLLAE